MFEVFALQGRHVAVVGVKFGVACRLISRQISQCLFLFCSRVLYDPSFAWPNCEGEFSVSVNVGWRMVQRWYI